jgi:hypothetical protein
MPILDRPLYGDEATGELANTLAFKKGIPFTSPGDEGEIPYGRLEIKRTGARSRSTGQGAQRDGFQTVKNNWKALTETEQAAWRNSAPAGWTGFNYYLFIFLRTGSGLLGEMILGEALFNQGQESPVHVPGDYIFNFSSSIDEIPVYDDGEDKLQAWQIIKLVISLQGIENYLIAWKDYIEGTV